jgi:hypothetical protein
MLLPGIREKFFCKLRKNLYEPWLEELEKYKEQNNIK